MDDLPDNLNPYLAEFLRDFAMQLNGFPGEKSVGAVPELGDVWKSHLLLGECISEDGDYREVSLSLVFYAHDDFVHARLGLNCWDAESGDTACTPLPISSQNDLSLALQDYEPIAMLDASGLMACEQFINRVFQLRWIIDRDAIWAEPPSDEDI